MRSPEETLLIEVKLTFPHVMPTAIRSFVESSETVAGAGAEEFWVVGLNGRPVDVRMIYPWQLYASG